MNRILPRTKSETARVRRGK